MTRWDPWRELEDMHNRLSTYFGNRPARRGEDSETMKATDWIPAVDIAEDEKAYIIKAELPEVAKEDVKVTMERGVLTISGERKLEKEEKGKKFHRIERAYGHFARSFNLPEDVDVANITATQKNGVLTVVVPKAPQSTPRQIDVKVS